MSSRVDTVDRKERDQLLCKNWCQPARRACKLLFPFLGGPAVWVRRPGSVDVGHSGPGCQIRRDALPSRGISGSTGMYAWGLDYAQPDSQPKEAISHGHQAHECNSPQKLRPQRQQSVQDAVRIWAVPLSKTSVDHLLVYLYHT